MYCSKNVFLRELEKFTKETVITSAYLGQAITNGLKQLYGEIGASTPVEVEKFTKTEFGATFLIRVPAISYVKVRSSIVLQNTYNSEPCAFHVLRVGSTLLDILSADRQFEL